MISFSTQEGFFVLYDDLNSHKLKFRKRSMPFRIKQYFCISLNYLQNSARKPYFFITTVFIANSKITNDVLNLFIVVDVCDGLS